MHWQVELLGGPRVVCGERVITRFESKKTVALLARLALQPQRSHPREELADLLWPDAEREVGLARLRHALWSLQRQLLPPDFPGAGPLEIDRQVVRVRPETLSCDATDFVLAVRHRRFDDAHALWGGELLPGFYEDWLCDEREQLNALHESLPPPNTAVPASTPTPLRAHTHYLPGYLTGFIGRTEERHAMETLLFQRRLITLLGPGGIGKTRLATELAQAVATRFAVIAFVPLAECVDASQLLDRVRAALQLAANEMRPPEQLALFLDERPTLLILDNLEQLLESGIAEAVEELLLTLPCVTCLTTSRRRLDIPGEQVFPLHPLPAEQSLALFLDRAQSVRPDFARTERNEALLAQLCTQLEGHPLALEMAASRIRSLSLTELQSQLTHRLQELARPHKTARHASLHAAIDWSWRLLPPRQQLLLAQLSVLRGGGSRAAIIALSELPDAAERLEELVDSSLLVREETPSGQTRFRLLELIRSFTVQQLPAPIAAQTRARHRQFFAANATNDDAGNLLAALESAASDHDPETGYALLLQQGDRAIALLGAATAFHAAQAILALPPPTPRVQLCALSVAVSMAEMLGSLNQAQVLGEQALLLAGEVPALRAIALSIQGQLAIAHYTDPVALLPRLELALTDAATCGDTVTEATLHRRRGILQLRSGAADAAASSFARSEQLFRDLGDATGARYALANRAHVLGAQGDNLGSLALYQECLRQAEQAGDLVHQSKLLLNIGSLHTALGQWNAVRQTTEACLRLCQAIGNLRTLTLALWNLPEPLLRAGQPERAVRLMHFAERFWQEHFGPLSASDTAELTAFFQLASGVLDTATLTALEQDAHSFTLTQALALALSPTG